MPDLISQIDISEYKHIVPIQVRFNDSDKMGHVTNMQYLGYCDISRLKFFNDVLQEKIEYSKESLVIASVKLDFIKQIFIEEDIDVRTKITNIGNKSVQMSQIICNPNTLEIKCLVHTVMSGFNYIDQQSIVIPDRWRAKLL